MSIRFHNMRILELSQRRVYVGCSSSADHEDNIPHAQVYAGGANFCAVKIGETTISLVKDVVSNRRDQGSSSLCVQHVIDCSLLCERLIAQAISIEKI